MAPNKRLIYYPDYRARNPYQRLLYAHAQDWQTKAGDITKAIKSAQKGIKTAFHLNWTPRLFKDMDSSEAHHQKSLQFLKQLAHFQNLGGRVVWTIHNRLPHHCPFPESEILFRRLLGEQVDLIHLHEAHHLSLIEALYPLPAEKLIFAAHGHYLGAYQGRLLKRFTRQRLGLPLTAPVFSAVGQLRSNKGIESFMAAAAKAQVTALIAGEPVKPTPKGYYKDLAQKYGLFCHEGFLKTADMADLLSLSDWVILPYQDILTSGSFMLAASAAKPVILPCLESFKHWQGLDFVQFYDPDKPDDLPNILIKTAQLGRETAQKLGLAARAHMQHYHWEHQFSAFFKHLSGLVS